MSNCACKASQGLKAVIIHDLSGLPYWRRTLLALCSECIEKHGLYCAEHQIMKVCLTTVPRTVYALHPEVLSRVCHMCALAKAQAMDSGEKSRLVSLVGQMSDEAIICSYIPEGDRHLFSALNPIDLTIFGLLFGAEVDKVTLHEIAARVAGLKMQLEKKEYEVRPN